MITGSQLWDAPTIYENVHESVYRASRQRYEMLRWMEQGVPGQAIIEWSQWQNDACSHIDALQARLDSLNAPPSIMCGKCREEKCTCHIEEAQLLHYARRVRSLLKAKGFVQMDCTGAWQLTAEANEVLELLEAVEEEQKEAGG